jgi:DNA-binding CsgD family transcriptional regulator/PAS domain-containing protein
MHADPMLMDLYACSARPAHWPQTLDRLCDETGACSAVVQAFRFDGDQARPHWQAMDTRTTRGQRPPHAGIENSDNPRLTRRGLRGLNRVVRDEELFDPDDPARDALQRRLAAIGMGRFLGALQPLDDGSYLGIALHRAVDETRDFGRTQAARLEQLAPHLRQAWQLSARLHAAEHRLQALHAHLDTLRCGLLVCDAAARAQWMNRSARAIVDGGQALWLHGGTLHGSTLRACSAAQTAALHEQIASAGPEPRFVALGDGSGLLHAALRAEGDSVLLALTRTRDAADVPVQAWCRLLGVTPAEAALVATLAAGGTLEAHAQRRGIALGTVRIQLKQVLAKTGTHRQAELVRLALSSAAAHVLGSVAAA